MDERLEALLADVARAAELAPVEQARAARRAKWLAEAIPPQLCNFFTAVGELPLPFAEQADALLLAGLSAWVRSQRQQAAKGAAEFVRMAADEALAQNAVSLYERLGPQSRARSQLLAWLATAAQPAGLEALSRLLIDDPPLEDEDIVQALPPLFTARKYRMEALFPQLLAALSNPALAAPVLDLANYLTRNKLVSKHPGEERKQELIGLLGRMAESLARMEERPTELDESAVELSRRVASSVALTVSLCDALAQIGDDAAIPKLYQVLDLGHRRLRTEAAAALAKLGEQPAVTALVQLAAEPVARLRAIAYAAELGVTDKIDAQYRTPQARAEAELTVWLAEPTQFGVPPTQCELFDQRRQFWPGFSELVDCFLLRFSYTITVEGGERTYSNIGIAGPLVHAFTADLADLSPDDIYAAYAGWQASHEDIFEHDVSRLSRTEKLEVVRLERRLHDAGYANIRPQQMGYFFGERALTALADHATLAGVAVVDFQDIVFLPQRNSRRPLGVREVYSIYKGRKLLRTFNRGE